MKNNKVKYTYEEILNAYNTWVNASGRPRVHEWTTYCDMRDGERLGTNYERHLLNTRYQDQEDALEAANKIARAAFIDNIGMN